MTSEQDAFRGRTRRWLWLGVFVSLALPHTPGAAQASEGEMQQARTAFQAGKSAFEQARYDEALQQFDAADRAVPSPNTKLMMARCLSRLDRPAEAYTLLGSLIQQARAYADGRYEQAAAAAEQERLELEPRIALRTVEVSEATIDLATRSPASPSAVRDQPATARAGTPALRDRDAIVTAESVTTESSSLRTWAYVSGGAGVASIAAFAVFGALSNSAFAELDEACSDRTACAPALRDTAQRGRTYQTLANVSLGFGVAALGAGAVLWVVGTPDDGVEVALDTTGVRVRGTL